MEPSQIQKIDLLEESGIDFSLFTSAAEKKHAAEEVLIETAIEASGNTQSTGSRKRQMVAAVSSRQGLAAANQPARSSPRFGAAPPLPIPNPPLPPLPPSGGPDGTVQGWDGSQWEAYNANHTGYMNGLMNLFFYYSAHPTTSSLYALMNYINGLAQHGLLNSNVDTMMQLCNGQYLIADGIEHNAEFAFLMGYTDSQGKLHQPGGDAYKAYLSDLSNYLGQVEGSYPNGYTAAMVSEVNTLIKDQDDFINAHTDPVNGLYWTVLDQEGYNTNYYWNAAGSDPDADKFIIEQVILSSGTNGAPNQDIAALVAVLGKLQTFDLLNTMDAVWNKYHDPGLLILAFMQTLDGGYLNSESGNADIMDKQHQLDEKYAQQIQSIVSSIGTWDDTSGSGADSCDKLASLLEQMAGLIHVSNQFTALQDPMLNFLQNLKSTSITPGTSGLDVSSNTNLYQVLVEDSYTDSKGVVHTLTSAQRAVLIHDNLTPSATPPTPQPTPPNPPPPYTPPNTEILQGFISSISAISSAVSSSSTQLTTATSQVEQMHQAILKVGTGVVDPKNGLMAVTNNAITHQVTN